MEMQESFEKWVKFCKHSPCISESVLHQAVVDAINKRFVAISLTEVIHPISEFDNVLAYSLIAKIIVRETGFLEFQFRTFIKNECLT